MNEIKVIENNGQRVLTTVQIAELYGTDSKVISNNFNRNKERYTEGKHYYCLTGDAKRGFVNRHQIEDGSKASNFYLWTEKGALLHAKSLNIVRKGTVLFLLLFLSIRVTFADGF